MFEKEAEEMAKDYAEHNQGKYTNEFGNLYHAYLAGAEFGYNKANAWRYPSKGEYPKECESVLCYCADIKSCSIGHTIIGGDNKIRWWSSDRSEELKVYAWKEIVLPKEIEENEN